MTVLRDISIYWAMFHVIFLFLAVFRSRFTTKKTIATAVGGMGLLMAANGAVLMVYGFDTLSKLFLFTCSIPSFIFFYVMSAEKRFKFLFSFCLADTICLWVMAVTNLLDFYVGGGKYVLMFVSRLVVFPLLEYLAWRYLRRPYQELQKETERGWATFAGMTMLYYILLVVVAQFPTNIVNRPEDTFLCVLILLLMLFNYGTIFAALYRQLLLYRKQQSERILQEQKYTLEAQLDNQQNIWRMKHDMKGHAATLSGLLSAGKTQEAMEYLAGVEKGLEVLAGPFCTNPYINATLTCYYQKLSEISAVCRMDIQVGGEELPYMELCRILANGLENVCDALKKLEKNRREVSVHMWYHRDYLLVRIKNRCPDSLHVERGETLQTSKKEKGHGFGLLSIREAVERLDGDMVCYTENGYFMLDVMVRVRDTSCCKNGELCGGQPA